MLVPSNMATSMERLRVLRGLIRELRHVHKKGPVKETIAYNYLMEQYRKHQVTDQRICRAHQELQRNAETYLCLLKSTRLQQVRLTCVFLRAPGYNRPSMQSTMEKERRQQKRRRRCSALIFLRTPLTNKHTCTSL
ncbi:uncharacterized protein LOC144924249 isoform X1 [Branchiostoma floridae x Branchiostoma belcheri]